jgi:putative acetyltransferase
VSHLIRKFEDSDLDDLLYCWESASAVGHPFLTSEFTAKERDNIINLYLPNTQTWVAEEKGSVIGFLSLMGNEVGAIFVNAAFHGTGVGKALMDKARSLHRELELEVFKENEVGRAFYDRYGFVLLEEKLHEETGNMILRLKFTSQ